MILSQLPGVLAAHDYTEAAIAELLGLWDISELSGAGYSLYCWKCRPNFSPLSLLVQAFILGLPTTEQRLTQLLGEPLFRGMVQLGLLQNEGQLYSSTCTIYPCLGRLVVTDHWVSSGAQAEGKVYELGTDSYVLARVTPRSQGPALDLCTGSGVHAVHSARDHHPSWAVDINPRALDFTRLNAAMQGVEVHTELGDLYAPTGDRRFALITANPPFVPSPDPQVLIHRSAGATGEEVPERLVAGLPEKLEPGGLFSMVLEHPNFKRETYLNRLQRWLGEERGWGIAVLTFREYQVDQYILRHLGGVADPESAFKSYLRSYNRVGILGMRFANVFIKRLPYDAPNWQVEIKCPWPHIDISEQVQEWLTALTRYHDPDWSPADDWIPELGPSFSDLWVSRTSGQGSLQKRDSTWLEPPLLKPDEAELLSRILGGSASVKQLRAGWTSGDESFREALRGLGLARAIGVG